MEKREIICRQNTSHLNVMHSLKILKHSCFQTPKMHCSNIIYFNIKSMCFDSGNETQTNGNSTTNRPDFGAPAFGMQSTNTHFSIAARARGRPASHSDSCDEYANALFLRQRHPPSPPPRNDNNNNNNNHNNRKNICRHQRSVWGFFLLFCVFASRVFARRYAVNLSMCCVEGKSMFGGVFSSHTPCKRCVYMLGEFIHRTP